MLHVSVSVSNCNPCPELMNATLFHTTLIQKLCLMSEIILCTISQKIEGSNFKHLLQPPEAKTVWASIRTQVFCWHIYLRHCTFVDVDVDDSTICLYSDNGLYTYFVCLWCGWTVTRYKLHLAFVKKYMASGYIGNAVRVTHEETRF